MQPWYVCQWYVCQSRSHGHYSFIIFTIEKGLCISTLLGLYLFIFINAVLNLKIITNKKQYSNLGWSCFKPITPFTQNSYVHNNLLYNRLQNVCFTFCCFPKFCKQSFLIIQKGALIYLDLHKAFDLYYQ